MDGATSTRKYPSYTTAQLESFVSDGDGNKDFRIVDAAMIQEIADRKAGISKVKSIPQLTGKLGEPTKHIARRILTIWKQQLGMRGIDQIAGNHLRGQRQAFLSAYYSHRVPLKQCTVDSCVLVVVKNLPVGWGTDCYAEVCRKFSDFLAVTA